VVMEGEGGCGILGVIDGCAVRGIETEKDIADRKAMLRKFGYKL
jgi:adenosine/AMP kinase